MRLLQNAIRKTVKRRAKIILVVVLFGVAVTVGWQVVSCELANVELRSDLRDLAAQVGDKIGLNAPSTDDDLRSAVMRKANRLQIQLEPDQVTVQHTSATTGPALYLAMDYKARVSLLGLSFTLHFTPSSAR